MAIKFCREPIKDWVERYSNDDAPDNDGQKWSDQDQRPVSQKSKADYSNYENHEFFIRCTEFERSIIVLHGCGPLWFKSNLVMLKGYLELVAGNLLPVTIGNMIGGSIMVAAVYWFVCLQKL